MNGAAALAVLAIDLPAKTIEPNGEAKRAIGIAVADAAAVIGAGITSWQTHAALTPAGRPKATTGPTGAINRAGLSPEEYKAIAQEMVANFGTWSVNEADKTQTLHAEGALFRMAKEEMRNSPSASLAMKKKTVPADGTVYTWRRAK
jgi:hypothetical protein